MFITFEGIEGSGKTSQATTLRERLSGAAVLLTREPGGTSVGESIRHVLLSAAPETLDPLTELLLFSAARARLVAEVIRPALARGENVCCVRYSDSTRAYQAGAGGLPGDQVEELIRISTGGLVPDLTLYLDLPAEVGLARRKDDQAAGIAGSTEGWNAFDARRVEFHRRVREAYLELARQEPRRIVVIDASQPFAAVADTVYSVVSSALQQQEAVFETRHSGHQ